MNPNLADLARETGDPEVPEVGMMDRLLCIAAGTALYIWDKELEQVCVFSEPINSMCMCLGHLFLKEPRGIFSKTHDEKVMDEKTVKGFCTVGDGIYHGCLFYGCKTGVVIRGIQEKQGKRLNGFLKFEPTTYFLANNGEDIIYALEDESKKTVLKKLHGDVILKSDVRIKAACRHNDKIYCSFGGYILVANGENTKYHDTVNISELCSHNNVLYGARRQELWDLEKKSKVAQTHQDITALCSVPKSALRWIENES
jgi:hypothetical protein